MSQGLVAMEAQVVTEVLEEQGLVATEAMAAKEVLEDQALVATEATAEMEVHHSEGQRRGHCKVSCHFHRSDEFACPLCSHPRMQSLRPERCGTSTGLA